jgi:choline dehydrogenase-like flavoprotein
MISNAEEIENGACLTPDICVVGAGPAGIAMALDLSSRGLDVLLLESGFLKADPKTQSLYEGTVADQRLHSPPDKYRHRRFGGSSAIWGGRCMPMDPIDFEKRAYVENSGWPISYDDLLPYYPAANQLAEAGHFSYDSADALSRDVPPLFSGFESSRVRTTGIERFSCPTHFGVRYRKRLELESRVRVLLGANCAGIRLETGGGRVRALDVATLGGKKFLVQAKATVLAVGGLETARILLASTDVQPEGVGNRHDVVGRYYMCHIAGNVGTLQINGPTTNVRHGYEVSPDGVYCRRRLAVAPDEQRRLGLANSVARLHFPRITDPSHRNGVLSGLFLSRKLISYEYSKRLNDGNASAKIYARHLMNVVADPLDTSAFLAHWLTRRTLAERKFPSVILRNRTNRFSLEVHGEQMPLASSRVTLGSKVDALGMRQLNVDWRYCKGDIDSVERTLDVFSEEFQRSGVGRFVFEREALEEDLTRYGAYGGHHIGTARMGTDVRNSVVDSDCQVHSIHNLFVASSAVFPTSSQANPTLTLIAMALRVGNTIFKRLRPADSNFRFGTSA